MSENDGADWPRLLAELEAETDPVKINEKAYELESAIFDRCRELGPGPQSDEEKEALKRAAMTLLHVRVGKLGFPLDLKVLRNAGCSE